MPISGSNMLVLLLVALFLMGPERLPRYAQQLGQLVRTLKQLATQGSDRLREELGPEFDDIDLESLDPRQYDPRRIVRDVFREESGPSAPAGPRAGPRQSAVEVERDRHAPAAKVNTGH